jgi:outer membrane protein TolC
MKLLKSNTIITLSLSLIVAVPAHGEDLFSSLANKIAVANKSVIVSEKELASDQAALKAAIAPTDPEVTFDYLWPNTKEESNRWSAGISQQLPEFAKMKATGKVVKAIDSLKELEAYSTYKSLLYDANKLLIDYMAAKKEVALMHRIHENLDSLKSGYNKAWNRGEVSVLDVNKVQIEHARAFSANHEAESRMAAIASQIVTLSKGAVTENDLNNLTDYPTFSLIKGVDCSELSADASCHNTLDTVSISDAQIEEMVMESPQYKALEAKLNVADQKVNLASKSRLPRLSVGYNHAYEDGIHFNGVSAGLSLPVYSRNSEKVAAQEAALMQAAENDLQLTDMVAAAKADYSKAVALGCQIRLLGPAVDAANSLRLLKVALRGGEISLLEYLQETSYFIEAAKEYNAACTEYALVMASLARYSSVTE